MAADEAKPEASAPPRRLTRKVLFVLCTINLVDNINSTILVPYVDSMVTRLLGTHRGDPAVAPWVSVLVGSYSICEVLFSGLWGMLSDRIGRRPVLLVGLVGSAIAPVLLGLSQTLGAALAARLLDGLFCGNVGVTRTYLGELVDSSNEAKAFGMLSMCFSLGIFIGPLLGGMLSEPCSWAPGVFAGTIFERFPYLLPNLAYACFAVAAFVVGFCSLQETRAPRARSGQPQEALIEAGTTVASTEERRANWNTNLVKLIVAFGLLRGYTAARLQGFVLVVSLPRSMGGFALGPQEFGYFQVVAAVFIFATQRFLYERGIRRFGPHGCYRWGLVLTVLLTLPFPLYGLLADPERFGFWRYVPPALFQGISQIGFSFTFPTVFMLINRECSAGNRGSINGWANSVGAFCCGLFPVITGALVRVGCKLEAGPSGLPGGRYLALYVNVLAAAASIWLVARQVPTARCAVGGGGQ